MAAPNLAAAVSAVIIAYQTSRDLLQSLRLLDNHWRKHTETAIKEKLLSNALAAGENHVANRYAAIYGELGEQFRIADAESQSKLLRIAQLIRSKIVDNLQNAIKYDNAPLNYEKVTQDAVLFRRAALGVLEELRQYFMPDQARQELDTYAEPPRTPPRTHPAFQDLQTLPEETPQDDRSSTYSTELADEIKDIMIEPDSELEQDIFSHFSDLDENPVKSKRFSRLFSKRKTELGTFPVPPANLSLLKHFDWHGSELHADPNEKRKSKASEKIWYSPEDSPVDVLDSSKDIPRRESTTLGAWDKWRIQRPSSSHHSRPDSTTLGTLEGFDRPAPLRRQPSGSASEGSSVMDRISSNGTSTPATSPGSDTNSGHWKFPPRESSLPQDALSASDVPAVPVKSPLRSLSNHRRHETSGTYDSSTLSRPVSSVPTSAPSVASNRSMTQSLTPQVSLQGRPTKKNNYWGFCKGAWATREAPSSGLKIQSRPNGMYNTISSWQCKHCSFESAIIGRNAYAKKPGKDKDSLLDRSVHTKAGVMYRWVFLAKSHVKTKGSAEASYGCLFCSLLGRSTSVYGNVETLMEHIALDHSRDVAREDIQQRANCVYGRVASAKEEFDICIPGSAGGGRLLHSVVIE